jgi:hypothetical protein
MRSNTNIVIEKCIGNQSRVRNNNRHKQVEPPSSGSVLMMLFCKCYAMVKIVHRGESRMNSELNYCGCVVAVIFLVAVEECLLLRRKPSAGRNESQSVLNE